MMALMAVFLSPYLAATNMGPPVIFLTYHYRRSYLVKQGF